MPDDRTGRVRVAETDRRDEADDLRKVDGGDPATRLTVWTMHVAVVQHQFDGPE